MRAVILASIALTVGGCQPWPHYGSPKLPPIAETPLPAPAEAQAAEPAGARPARSAQKFIQEASPVAVGGSSSESASGSGPGVIINFEQAPIAEVVRVILGETLKAPFTIEDGVTGSVSLVSQRAFTNEELLSLLEQLLAVNGAVLVRGDDDVYRVLPRPKVKETVVPLVGREGRRQSAVGYRTEVFTPRHIGATELRTLLTPMISPRVELTVDEQRNIIIAAGTGPELTQLREALVEFDVDWMAGMSVGLFPVSLADVSELSRELNLLVRGSADGGAGTVVRIEPLERLGAILVVTSEPAYLDRVETWIERLDKVTDSDERRLFVYRVQNGKAADLANVLNVIVQSGVAGGSSAAAPALAPGYDPVEIGTAREPRPANAVRRPNVPPTNSTAPQIIADESNNALVIMATAREFRMIQAALRQLDLPPLQVLIEASIIEVSLLDDLQYGVEWFFKNNFDVDGETKQGFGLLDLGGGGIGPLAPGFSYALVDDASQVRAVLNMLASESELNVLSSPSLMVLGNQTATINVGDEVPIPTRQSVSNIDPAAPTVNEIEYRDTGVILEVTPRVNSGGLVTMDVAQEVSDVGPTTTSGIDAPTFQQRKIASTVAVQSGNTVILGGLIRDRAVTGESGIPVLYKIPVLGKLFGATNNTAQRTELLVLITPRVVGNASDATEITRAFRTKLRSFERW